jgi:ABC-type sugar transport system permease subunit
MVRTGPIAELKAVWRNPLRREDMLIGLLFLAPSLLVLVGFTLLPVLAAFGLSFTNWVVRFIEPQWVGVTNYIALARDPNLHRALLNTLYFTAVKLPLDMVLALSIAMVLNRKVSGLVIYRTAYFLPVITSVVAASAVWRLIYNPNFGLANSFLDWIGLPAQRWLSDPVLAMPAVILVALWKGLGYNVIIFLAGLQTIPQIYYEAAEVDGATSWQRFRYITFPLLSPITYFILVIGIINSFKVFSLIHVMTPTGGPLKSTEVLVFLIYRMAFQEFKFGQAAAVAFILFTIVVLVTYLQRRFVEPRVHYE